MQNIKLYPTVLRDKNSGKDLVKLLVPEGWTTSATSNKNSYRGYGQSITVQADVRNKNNSVAIFYTSALHYRDDNLHDYKDLTTDLYGNLYRKLISAEDFLDVRARGALKDTTDLKMTNRKIKADYAQKEKELREKSEKSLSDNMSVIDRVYVREIMQEYSFKRNGYPRKRVLSAHIEAVEYVVWAPLPSYIIQALNTPFMADLARGMMSAFPNARYDESLNQWIYTIRYYTDWYVKKLFAMDAPESEYNELFNNVFLPVINYGSNYEKDLINDMNALQAEINDKNKKRREEKERQEQAQKEERKRQEAIDKENRRRRQETWDYVHKTQQEIAAMRKDSWEKSQKSQAKVREMWGDTLRGDTRFVDKYGDEHVIHTYDKYAYKSGNTYVTSDSPLDHGWDWEELEQKKY